MGRKRIRTGERFYLYAAGLILLSLWGCSTVTKEMTAQQEIRKTEEEVFSKEPPKEPAPAPGEEIRAGKPPRPDPRQIAWERLRRAQKLLAQGDYEGSAEESQRVLSAAGKDSPADWALYHLGLIYAHFGNPKRNYERSLFFFKKLLKDFPASPLGEETKIWCGILQENEKLAQMIENYKKVDIAVEEKKREKGR